LRGKQYHRAQEGEAMTTKPSIGKRLLGVMLAVPMALDGM
jgi:hypothetical protein